MITKVNTRRIIFGFLKLVNIAYFLSACSALNGPLFKPVNNIPENQSVVYMYRLENKSNTEFLIKSNGQDICILKNNGYFPFFVKPGRVDISSMVQFKLFATGILDAAVREPSKLVLKAETGKSYYIKCETDEITGQDLIMDLVPENFGSKNIKECKLLESGL
jgi:Protein of unknown function (DUF2846)